MKKSKQLSQYERMPRSCSRCSCLAESLTALTHLSSHFPRGSIERARIVWVVLLVSDHMTETACCNTEKLDVNILKKLAEFKGHKNWQRAGGSEFIWERQMKRIRTRL
jgi:hypothetical protein